MDIFRDIDDIPDIQRPVITIGSFDGVHFAHQQILNKVKDKAKEIDGKSVVVTFHPHPRQIIYPKDNSLDLLSSLDEKLYLFQKYGIDVVVVVPFSIEFSQQSPREYVEKFLLGKFKPHCIVIGYDHRFGLNREGNIDLLMTYQEAHGFELIEIEKQELESIAISSTKIRKAIKENEFIKAQALLNHPYIISGKVISGKQVGHELGFPTANIEIKNPRKLIPNDGIYAVRIIHNERTLDGMLYIGQRPTIEDDNQRSIEINIFDFNEILYHEYLQVEILSYIREDMAFNNLDELKEQLSLDKKMVQAFLENK